MKVERSPKPLASAMEKTDSLDVLEAPRGARHPGAQDVLVGRHADKAPEHAQEMMLAEARPRREAGEIERLVGALLDQAQDFDQAADSQAPAPAGLAVRR